ncbi:MAG: hypothetical protein ACREF4_15265 [Gammaproteobacteria bacterium]
MIVQVFRVKDAADDWAELEAVPPRLGAQPVIAGMRVTHAMPAVKSMTVRFHRSVSVEFKVGNALALAYVLPEDQIDRKPVPVLNPKFVKGV